MKSLNGSSADSKKYGVHAGPDLSYMFQNTGVTGGTLKANMLDTSAATNMKYMLYSTKSTDWDISGWETDKCTDLSGFFYSSSYMGDLDLRSWNVSGVKNLSYFLASAKAPSVNMSGWDTGEVEDLSGLFSSNTSTTSASGLSNFNTAKNKNLASAFSGSKILNTHSITNWNTSNVTNMSSLFANTTLPSSTNINGWNTTNLTDITSIFSYATINSALDLRTWNPGKISNLSNIFYNTVTKKDIDISDWIIPSNPNLTNSFSYLRSASGYSTKFKANDWENSSNITSLPNTFVGCGTTTFEMHGLDLSSMTNISELFKSSSVKILDLTDWKTASIENLNSTFANSQIETIDLSGWELHKRPSDYSTILDARYMFKSSSIKTIYLGDKFNLNYFKYTQGSSYTYTKSPFSSYSQPNTGWIGERYDVQWLDDSHIDSSLIIYISYDIARNGLEWIDLAYSRSTGENVIIIYDDNNNPIGHNYPEKGILIYF